MRQALLRASVASYHDSRTSALFREMEADPSIFLIGGVVTLPGVNPETPVEARFPGRVVWTSIAEFSSMSIGTGAAMVGMRPFIPIGTASFMFYGWPAVTLEAPNIRYVTGGQLAAPVVFHTLTGLRRGSGVDHEHSPQAMLQQIPGLRIYSPGTPEEIDGVLHSALTGGDPTVIVDHKGLATVEGAVTPSPMDPDHPYFLREGSDVLIVAHSAMVQLALAASDELAAASVSAAVLSTPLLNPAPIAEILDLVGRFRKIVLIDEARPAGSFAAYLASQILTARMSCRLELVCTRSVPSPGALTLGDAIIPTVARVVDAVRSLG